MTRMPEKQPKQPKIYRRPTLPPKMTVRKKKNEKNRFRNQIMNFRVSPEEKEMILERIQLSGLSKQDFYLQSMLYQQVVTYGNIKVFDEFRRQITVITERINQLAEGSFPDEETLETLRMITEMIDGLQHQDEDIVSPMIDDHKQIKANERNQHFKRGAVESSGGGKVDEEGKQ